jgi:hypothetical protein
MAATTWVFWCECSRRARQGSSAFANDWQWVFGVPAASGIGTYIATSRGLNMTTGYPILDGLIAAFVAFLITWAVAFAIRLIKMVPVVFEEQKNRADQLEERLQPKLKVEFDKSNLSCDAEVGFTDGTKSRCIRLRVENTGTLTLAGCQGWLTIKELPGVSAARLIWTGPQEKGAALGIPPEIVDLHHLIPQYVQVFRITQSNQVRPGTQMDIWPIDAMDKFVTGREYEFKVGLTADHEAGTIIRVLKLNWTGDWRTATVTDVTEQAAK